jgi:anti-sigma factor RsiW
MAADPALAAECARLEALQRLMRKRLSRKSAPPGLRTRVEASIGIRRPRVQPSWHVLAASIAVAAMVASGSTWGRAFSFSQVTASSASSPPTSAR